MRGPGSTLYSRILVLAVVSLLAPNSLTAQVGEEWVARYNGPANRIDIPVGVGLDGAGDVYVTGSSCQNVFCEEWDIVTIKYDREGNELWRVHYLAQEGNWDLATALAVDWAGNVYVTGGSDTGGTASDYATVMYDPAGWEVWSARYNGPANDNDVAEALAIDTVGNVYVTGAIGEGGISRDYGTIKYGPGGEELWVARYGVPGD